MATTQEEIELVNSFLNEYYKEELNEVIFQGKKSIRINFQKLSEFAPDFAQKLIKEPEEALQVISISIVDNLDNKEEKIRVRLSNPPQSILIDIKNIRKEHLGVLVSVRGIILQASQVKQRIDYIRFECTSCGSIRTIIQTQRNIQKPHKCGCGNKTSFRRLEEHKVDVQKLVVGEDIENLEGGEQPRQLNVYLEESLCSAEMLRGFNDGNRVEITGILKSVPPYDKKEDSVEREVVLEAIDFVPLSEDFETLQISQKDIQDIQELSKSPDLIEKFVASIAPDIYGHEMVKEALVYCLFGGLEIIGHNTNRRRGEIHLLFVGDPGTAKTMLAKSILKIAPKVRRAGTSSTGVGLTATVTRNDFLGGSYVLEAGTLALANKGHAVIDELDKLKTEERNLLHEPMEEGIIEVNKANIHATLSAKTAIVVACNPILGRFVSHQTIASQIDIVSTLLNRFDLILVFRDIVDLENDKKVADVIIANKRQKGKHKVPVDSSLFKKYVSYARQHIFPDLSEDDAATEFKDFYLEIRKQGGNGNPIPINARSLNTLMRLAEASARARLSQVISSQDITRAKKMLMFSLEQTGLNPETGVLDIDRITESIGSKTKKDMFSIKNMIKQIELAEQDHTAPYTKIVDEALKHSMTQDEVDEAIHKLKMRGDLFEPRTGRYKVQ